MSEEQNMSQAQFREAKESGVDLYAVPDDAEEQLYDSVDDYDESTDYDDAAAEYDADDADDDVEETVDDDENEHHEQEDEDGLPKLTPREQTAFQKRMAAEDLKMRERYQTEFEERYAPYREILEGNGITPEMLSATLEENGRRRALQEAAYQNGIELTEAQIQHGISIMREQHLTQRLQDMERMHQAQINQLALEARQREAVKRSTSRRTVASDSSEPLVSGSNPLMLEEIMAAKQMGLSEKQARSLRDANFNNIKEYRAWKAKQSKSR